jgi:ADP-heptose:LPS heptosyltransferase
MKILVISLAGIGDTILSTPLIRELRTNFPDSTIDSLVLWPGSKELLENNPCLNRVHQKHLINDSKLSSVRFIWGLRREHYDVSINTHPQSRIHYRICAWLAGARVRVSHVYESFTPLDTLLVNRTLPQDYGRNTADQNLDVLGLLGKKTVLNDHRLELFPQGAETLWAERFIGEHRLESKLLVGLHAGSGGTKNLKLKRWPLDHYVELLKRGTQSWPHASFLLFGGPDETPELDWLSKQVNSPALIRVQGKLREAAALMKRCKVFLSVDTALMHVAAALRVPRQIVIEAPTFNKTNEPYHQPFDLVRNPVVNGRNLEYYKYDGKPIRGTREELIRCMASVTVDSVYQVLRRAVEE